MGGYRERFADQHRDIKNVSEYEEGMGTNIIRHNDAENHRHFSTSS